MAHRKLLESELKMYRRISHIFYLVIVVSILLTLLSGCATKGPYRCYLGMFHGKIHDVDTGEPLEGAVVHVTYSIYGSTPAGSIGTQVAVREALTNAKGEYVIPEDTMMHECFSGKLQGRMQIFKPGYGIPGHPGYTKTCPEEEKEEVRWADEPRCLTVEGKYLIWGLKKLKTKEERKVNVGRVRPSTSLPMKNQLLLIDAINRERISLGRSKLYVD